MSRLDDIAIRSLIDKLRSAVNWQPPAADRFATGMFLDSAVALESALGEVEQQTAENKRLLDVNEKVVSERRAAERVVAALTTHLPGKAEQ